MNSHTLSAAVLAGTLVLALQAAPAQAAAQIHTYVNKLGNDANAGITEACNISSPCLSLNAAMTNTLAGGIITILDEYGVANTMLTITKSLTIEGRPGVNAVIPFASSSQIDVAATSSDVVTFRNVTIVAQGTSFVPGIHFSSGRGLVLDEVWLKGFNDGLSFIPGTAAAGGVPSQLHVSNSVIGENTGVNIFIESFGAVSAAATLDRVTVRNGVDGVRARGNPGQTGQIDVEAVESVASGNSGNGFFANSTTGNPAVHFKVTRSIAHNNGLNGAKGDGAQAFMIVSGSSLAKNGTGLAQANSSTVATYTNNDINFNNGGSNTSGTITPIPQK